MKRAPRFRRRVVTTAIALAFVLELAGCAAFILGSAVGSLGYAGYQYAQADSRAHATPDAQPTLSLNDIE